MPIDEVQAELQAQCLKICPCARYYLLEALEYSLHDSCCTEDGLQLEPLYLLQRHVLTMPRWMLAPIVQRTPWSVSYFANDHANSITEGCGRITEVLETGKTVC